YQATIGPESTKATGMTMLLVSNGHSDRLEAIRKHLQGPESFWVNQVPNVSEAVNGYGQRPPAAGTESADLWNRIDTARMTTAGINRIPTDDWPFLYLREPRIPDLNMRGIVLVGAVSIILLFAFAPERSLRPNGSMFFLGAGFMLLETRATVH